MKRLLYGLIGIALLLGWALFIGLLFARAAQAAIASVQATSVGYIDNGTTGSVSFSATPGANSLIVVTMSESYTGGSPRYCNTRPVSAGGVEFDGFLSTFQGLNSASAHWHYLTAAPSGTYTITVTCQFPSYVTFQAREYSGALSGLSDVIASANGIGAVATVATSQATTYADGLVIAVLAEDTPLPLTITPQSGYTQDWEQEDCTTHQCGSAVRKLTTAIGTQSHTWTLAGTVNWSAILVTFGAATQSGGTTIPRSLSWTDNQPGGASNEQGFRIEKRTDQTAPNFVLQGTVGPDVTSWNTSIQSTETNDCWRVQAFNQFGSSGYSNTYCTSVTAPPPPPPPGSCVPPAPGTAITRILTGPHATNPRYFTDSLGCPIYLTGSHTWSNLQDGDGNAFNWSGYLATLSAQKHTLARLWLSLSPYGNLNFPAPGFNGSTPWYSAITPNPYARHGSTCCAADGGNKFDLDTFNSTFWTRLNDRVHDLKNAGIYAQVMAFNRFDSDNATAFLPGRDVWAYHPYHANNNMNSLNGDANGNGNGEELQTLAVGSSASIGAVGSVSNVTGTTHTTANMNVNAGSTLAVCINMSDTETISSVKLDDTTNFTQIGSDFVGGADGSRHAMYYKENVGASATRNVVVVTSANTFIVVHAVELRGVPTSGVADVSNVQRDIATPFDSPSVTPSTSTSIAVGCGQANTSANTFTQTAGNGFTKQASQDDGAVNWVTWIGTRLLTTASALNTTMSYSGGTVGSTTQSLMIFKASSSGDSALTTRQKAFLAKLCDELCDEPNVILEMVNEAASGSVPWANELMAYWRTYCQAKTYCPPIGHTGVGSITLAELYTSNGVYTSPGAANYGSVTEPLLINPPETDGVKIQISDSDHLFYMPVRDDAALAAAWVWKSFTRGYHVSLMEDLQPFAGWLAARQAMGQTRLYADRIPLGAMPPQQTLCSTTYCLIAPGAHYLVYQPTSGAFSVTMIAGTYTAEWFNVDANAVASSASYTATTGANQFTPPFGGQAVLYLKIGSTPEPPPPPPPLPAPPYGITITGVPSLLEEEML